MLMPLLLPPLLLLLLPLLPLLLLQQLLLLLAERNCVTPGPERLLDKDFIRCPLLASVAGRNCRVITRYISRCRAAISRNAISRPMMPRGCGFTLNPKMVMFGRSGEGRTPSRCASAW